MKPRNKSRTKNREKSSACHPIEPVIEFRIQDGIKLVSTAKIIAREREVDKLEQRVKEKRLKLEEMISKLSCPKKSDSRYKRQREIRHYSPIYDEPRPRRLAPVEFASADNDPYERSPHDPYGYNNFPPPSRPSSPFYSCEQFAPHTMDSSMWQNSWNSDFCEQTFGDPEGSWNYWDDFDYGGPHLNESFQRNSDLCLWSSTINMAQDEWNEPLVSSTCDVLPRTNHQERIRNRKQRTRNLLEPKREGSQVRGQCDLPLERSCIKTEREICSVCQLPGHPASMCQPK